ncbi:MAG: HD-GYP domain-containing protein [Desulfovibrionaceae bacterium]
MAKPKHDVPDGLNEEYYQIGSDILGSFNKYRPPLDIFLFKEDVSRVMPYYRKGGRLSNEQVEELAALVEEGVVFVSRNDHPVYVKHISYQLDLVLVDKNLKESEIADIFQQALTRRAGEFFDQPVKPVYDKLYVDLMVLTEYLFEDPNRVRALLKRLHAEHSLANHAFNTLVAGLGLFVARNKTNFEEGGVKRKYFDNVAVGLTIHDLGMTKIPPFVRDKTKPLTTEERGKILQHPKLGNEMLIKFDAKFPEVEECVLDHHERLTGQGYPQKKKGEEVGKVARLCAVVDSFCAMTVKRPYAEAMDQSAAAAALGSDPGYDSDVTGDLKLMVMEMKGLIKR